MAVLPIAHFNAVPFQEVTGSFNLGVVGTHRVGLDGVVFRDAGGLTQKRRAKTITRNTQTNNFEYWGAINCAGLAAFTGGDGLKTINATVYPSIPGLTFLKQYAPRVLSIQLQVFAGAITYPATFYVDPVGGLDSNPGSSISPFQTIKRAVDAVTAAGAQNGGRILLRAGTYTETTAPSSDCIQTNRYLHIEADTGSGASKANITINRWPSSDGMRCTFLHLKNVKLSSSLAGITTRGLVAPAPRYCWLDNVDAQGVDTSTLPTPNGWVQWASSFGVSGFENIYWTSGTVSLCRRVQGRARLIRNVQAGLLGECKLESNKCVVNFAVLGVNPTGLSSPVPEIWSVRNTVDENFLVWGLQAFGLTATPGIVLAKGSGGASTDNVGLVNVFIEGDALSAAVSDISDTDTAWIVNHLVFEHVGIVNQTFRVLNKVRAYSFDATYLQSFTNTAGLQFDSGDAPNGEWDHRGLDFMHYISAGTQSKAGRHVSTGPPLFNNPATDDYRPGSGSPLYLGTHKLFRPSVPHDAAQQLRGQTRTAIGPFRSTIEEPGGAVAPSWPTTAAAYPPGPVSGVYVVDKGLAMSPIVPVAPSGGAPTRYRLLPSIDAAYRPQAEILADPDNAHFEVRLWKTGDPTKVGGFHSLFVVVDLRYGHIYLDHPKLQGQAFVPHAVAGCLAAPFAADANAEIPGGMYTTTAGSWTIPDGPITTHGQRGMIRIDGDPSQGLIDSQHWSAGFANQGYASGITGGIVSTGGVVAWAGQRGLGGFFPFSAGTSALQGKGRLVELTYVGANLGKTDRLRFPELGGGIIPSGGSPLQSDHTYNCGDVLLKQLQWGPANGNGGQAIQSGFTKNRSGRVRAYECMPYSAGAALTTPFGPPPANPPWCEQDFLMKWGIHPNVGMYIDARRCIFPCTNEHGIYGAFGHGIFWGDIVGVPPGSSDNVLIDNIQPTASGRSMFQFAYRPGPCEHGVYTGAGGALFSYLPGPKGINYLKGNRCYGGSEGTTKFTFDGGASSAYILDGNEFHMQGSHPTLPCWYGPSVGFVSKNTRGFLFWAVNNKGAYFNDAGTLCGGIAILSHYDHTGNPDEKRLTVRGAGPVRVYDMEFVRDPGATGVKHAIEIDGEPGSGPIEPLTPFTTQFDKNGKWLYNQTLVFDPQGCPATQPIFGTPISNEGGFAPHTQDLLLLFNYPNPAGSPIWGYHGTGQKMVGWYIEKDPTHSDLSSKNFTDADINLYFKGRTLIDVLAASGIAFDTATGTFSGTPTASLIEGDIPFQHPVPGPTRFYVEASNGAGTTVGHVDIFVLDSGNQIIEMPTGVLTTEGPLPDISLSIELPTGRLTTTGLLPEVSSQGSVEIIVPMDLAVLDTLGGDPTPSIEITIEMPVAELVLEGEAPDVLIILEGEVDLGGSQGDTPLFGGTDGMGL